MKFRSMESEGTGVESLPAWGAWIEIVEILPLKRNHWSLPAWGAWIEILMETVGVGLIQSLPAWGAWIEIWLLGQGNGDGLVAPRMGSVD